MTDENAEFEECSFFWPIIGGIWFLVGFLVVVRLILAVMVISFALQLTFTDIFDNQKVVNLKKLHFKSYHIASVFKITIWEEI